MKLNALWAVLLVFFFAVFPSEKFELYTRVPNFDKLIHFLGGFVVGWLLWQVFSRDRNHITSLALAVLIIGGTAIVGIAWEIAERFSSIYWADAKSPWLQLIHRYFYGGNLTDTLWDLTLDMGGALLFTAGTLLTRERFTKN